MGDRTYFCILNCPNLYFVRRVESEPYIKRFDRAEKFRMLIGAIHHPCIYVQPRGNVHGVCYSGSTSLAL